MRLVVEWKRGVKRSLEEHHRSDELAALNRIAEALEGIDNSLADLVDDQRRRELLK